MKAAGFTLLEMLVALVVFGVLMAALSQTVRYGMTAWSAETRNAVGPADAAAVDGALRRLIEQAAPGGFSGRADQFSCTTSLPAGSGLVDRLADVAVLIAPGQRLILRWRPHPAGILFGAPPPPQNELLLSGVQALRVSYFGPQQNAPPAWSTTWKSNAPPLLVRLSLSFTGRRSWPDLVAAPIVQAPAPATAP